MNCHCKKDNVEFYDIEYLKSSKIKADDLIENVKFQNPNLINYHRRNNALPMFNDISLKLVKDFAHYAHAYVRHLISNKFEFAILYYLAKEKTFTSLYIEYMTFPLVNQPEKKEIIKEIEKMALVFYENSHCVEYKITCMELLYFYALLINPDYNWVIMDYINNGNKNHQYLVFVK